MKRGKPLRRGKPLQRGKPLKASQLKTTKRLKSEARLQSRPRVPRTVLDQEASEAWQRYVLLRAHGKCECCGQAPAQGEPLQAHHVTRQQDIKRYVRSLQLPPVQRPPKLRSLLWDKRNGMALRGRCHTLHTSQLRKVPRAKLRPEHWQFARELGLDYLLEKQYAA